MDFDYFFYYGQVDEDDEVKQDLLQGILQDTRSMFYHRSFGAGIKEWENRPNGLAFNLGIRYGIADWMARRNLEVSDGSNGTWDRRVVTSQSIITVEGNGENVDIQIPYLRYADVNRPKSLVVVI